MRRELGTNDLSVRVGVHRRSEPGHTVVPMSDSSLATPRRTVSAGGVLETTARCDHGHLAPPGCVPVARFGWQKAYRACHGGGDFATAIADGHVNNPTAIWATIKARPNQKADGNWSMVCSRGSGAGTKSGDYSGTTPFTRKLKMPYAHPDDCTVSALGGLSDGGKIIVILYART